VTGPSKHVFLVRHGETEWSRSGQHTGRTDIPLTENGRAQAQALGRFLQGREFQTWTSPLLRARETCRLAGFEPERIDEDLLEWDYGQYEGRTTAEIQGEIPGWLVWDAPIVGGESVQQVGARVDRVIERVLEARGDVALFAHGHVLRIMAARWIGLPPEGGRLLALDTATISVLGYERQTRVVRQWNVQP
jgi:broad specificity phosphatase PhoE